MDVEKIRGFSDSHQELGKDLLACSEPRAIAPQSLHSTEVLMHPLCFMALITVCAGHGDKWVSLC